MGVVWAFAALGVLSEVFLSGRAVKALQIITYLGMGWACVYDLDGLRLALTQVGFFWLTAGGIAYTAGVIFYILDKMNKLPHAHGIWHIFVLAGSTCHFVSIVGYVR